MFLRLPERAERIEHLCQSIESTMLRSCPRAGGTGTGTRQKSDAATNIQSKPTDSEFGLLALDVSGNSAGGARIRWRDPKTVMRYGAKLAAKSGTRARLAARLSASATGYPSQRGFGRQPQRLESGAAARRSPKAIV